jgi:hypothetical protein
LPSTPEHRAKAEHNELLVSELDYRFCDWAVAGIFYAALQDVEAYFAHQAPPAHPATHQMRDNHINGDARLRPIYVDYRQLEDESRDAQYDASLTFTQGQVLQSQGWLNRIEAVVLPFLPV